MYNRVRVEDVMLSICTADLGSVHHEVQDLVTSPRVSELDDEGTTVMNAAPTQ